AAKKRLLGQFAYRAASDRYSLQLPESYALGILGEIIRELKEYALVPQHLTVGAIWQEIISNNFFKLADWRSVEWIHQLLFDFFLGSEMAHIWVTGSPQDKGVLWRRVSYAWGHACAIGLGLLEPMAGAQYLEFLISISGDLARVAFETQSEWDQALI